MTAREKPEALPGNLVLVSHLRKDLAGFPPTLRLGQDRAFEGPAIHPRRTEREILCHAWVSPTLRPMRRVGETHASDQFPVADDRSKDTPGPMVELMAIFFI